jgi:hypothetical protein
VRSSRWDKKTLIGANQTAANRERKPAKKAPEKMRKKPPKRNMRFYEKTKKKRCWINIQQRFRLGTECLIVSSFSTCKFGVHQNWVKIKQPLPSGQLAFTLVVHCSTVLGHV